MDDENERKRERKYVREQLERFDEEYNYRCESDPLLECSVSDLDRGILVTVSERTEEDREDLGVPRFHVSGKLSQKGLYGATTDTAEGVVQNVEKALEVLEQYV